MTKNTPAPTGQRGRPFEKLPEGPGTALARFLLVRLKELNLTNQEVSEKMGYARSSVVSSWKSARARFPLDNLYSMSELLEVDPAYMLALYIEQYVKVNDGVDRFADIHRMMSHVTTDDEWEIIQIARKARRNNSFKLRPDQRKALESIFEEPITTPEGVYQPLEIIEPEVNDARRKFARRGQDRDLTIDEIEEQKARKAAEAESSGKPKTPRKRSPAAKTPVPA